MGSILPVFKSGWKFAKNCQSFLKYRVENFEKFSRFFLFWFKTNSLERINDTGDNIPEMRIYSF